ncbi:MAG TPA: M48 family metalloprotease [Pyrinomonadaceae bacterium]|nr:M48 family metalloprotease [Pyrinomonadaceae bacterium]
MKKLYLLPLTCILFLALGISAQECVAPKLVFNNNISNSFTPEQEMFLGDAIAEQVERTYRVLPTEELTAYVQRIADRLTVHLPPSGIKYRVVIADIPTTNAFAMAGGRIFITRKMISFVRSEDELAAVIGHELGHAAVRHGAIDYSRYFKQLLGVTSFSDRRDVVEKYNRLIEAWRTKRVTFSDDHEDNQQLEADQVGVYAIYAAGYDANAMTTFWRRLTRAKERGGFVSFFLSRSRPADERLSEMLEAIKKQNPKCFEKLPEGRAKVFETWQNTVINFSLPSLPESLGSGLALRRQLPPLRPEIDHLRFSPDGKYILVQDSSTITILTREPLAIVFRIDAEEAYAANFSPDSREIVVSNENLRIQRWNIVDRSLVSTRELAIRSGYWQTFVSPDGKYAAVYSYDADLVVYDVSTNEEVFREKKFFVPTSWEVFSWQLSKSLIVANEVGALRMQYSPDSRYLIVGRRGSSTETLALDLTTMRPLKLSDNVKRLLLGAMGFLSPNKVIGVTGDDNTKAGIFSFPQGERLDQFELGGMIFTPAHLGDYVAVRPVKGAAVGLFDLKQKKYVLANRKSALDVYGDTFVAEQRNGELSLSDISTKQEKASIQLPPSPLFRIRALSLSPGGKWLTLSERSRGAVWNLSTAERVHHVRNFDGSFTTSFGNVFADFPRFADQPRAIAYLDSEKRTTTALPQQFGDEMISQYGPYLVVRRSNRSKDIKNIEKDIKKDAEKMTFSDKRPTYLSTRGTSMEVRSVETGTTLWSKDFPEETPSIFINAAENTMGFYWPADSEAAKKVVEFNPSLAEKYRSLKNKDYDQLIQIVDPASGVVRSTVLIETGEGSIRIDSLSASGDYLMVNDDDNRILVYSSGSGELLYRFFGSYGILSADASRIAVENMSGRVVIYDLKTGSEVERLTFPKKLAAMRFIDSGKRLFALSTDQVAYIFDVAKMGSVPSR